MTPIEKLQEWLDAQWHVPIITINGALISVGDAVEWADEAAEEIAKLKAQASNACNWLRCAERSVTPATMLTYIRSARERLELIGLDDKP